MEIFTQLLWKYVNNQHEDSLQTTKTVQIHLLFALCVEMDPLSLISTRRFQFGVIKGSLCLTFGSKDFLSSDLDGADTLWLVFISSSLFFPLQGHRKSRRAEQHLTCNTRPCLHGPGNPRYAPTKAATAGTGESRCAGRDRKGSQHGHRRVSTPVPQPTVELLNEKLPTGQKSLRQDRRSRWVRICATQSCSTTTCTCHRVCATVLRRIKTFIKLSKHVFGAHRNNDERRWNFGLPGPRMLCVAKSLWRAKNTQHSTIYHRLAWRSSANVHKSRFDWWIMKMGGFWISLDSGFVRIRKSASSHLSLFIAFVFGTTTRCLGWSLRLVGSLLQYPEICITFYDDIWLGHSVTGQMFADASSTEPNPSTRVYQIFTSVPATMTIILMAMHEQKHFVLLLLCNRSLNGAGWRERPNNYRICNEMLIVPICF